MTGAQHYHEAELALRHAGNAATGSPEEQFLLAKAHVHATLANTAALVARGSDDPDGWPAAFEAQR